MAAGRATGLSFSPLTETPPRPGAAGGVGGHVRALDMGGDEVAELQAEMNRAAQEHEGLHVVSPFWVAMVIQTMPRKCIARMLRPHDTSGT